MYQLRFEFQIVLRLDELRRVHGDGCEVFFLGDLLDVAEAEFREELLGPGSVAVDADVGCICTL